MRSNTREPYTPTKRQQGTTEGSASPTPNESHAQSGKNSEEGTSSIEGHQESGPEEASEVKSDFDAPESSGSPEESPEEHAKRMFASAIADRELNIHESSRSALDHISNEACAKGMQSITQFDESGKGPWLKESSKSK